METKEELIAKIDELEENFTNNAVDEIRGIIYCIQKTWNLTNSELAELVGRSEDYLDTLLHGDKQYVMVDFTMLLRLMILSLDIYKVQGCDMSDDTKGYVKRMLTRYCNMSHKPKKSREDMITELIKGMGVNPESYDEVETAYQNMQYSKKSNGDGKEPTEELKGEVFNSATMEEPKTFSFNLNSLKDNEEFKDVMGELGHVVESIFKTKLK